MRKRIVVAGGLVAALGVTAGLGVARASDGGPHASHILYISVDGMHESDLQWWIANNPTSTLAKLDHNGLEFTNAETSNPSDSYPGIVAPFTGGGPQTTGIYYDDEYSAGVFPPGTTNCETAALGTEVQYNEVNDKDPTRLDAGQVPNIAPPFSLANILKLNRNPDTLIDPKTLPVDPLSCQPIYPHAYLQVNTVFNVARNAGLFTAWSDKHPSNEILNGPSGLGAQDYFSPEINSDNPGPPAFTAGDWTADNNATMQYDGYKVAAVVNWIDGKFHDGTANNAGTPAIFGMNFQTLSTAQKLPISHSLTGGYHFVAGKPVPNDLVKRALKFVNDSVDTFWTHIVNDELADNTVIILSAKHGQSPMNPDQLVRIADTPIIAQINNDWHIANPTGANPLVAQNTDDDAMLLWLNDRSKTATDFVKGELQAYNKCDGTRTDLTTQAIVSGLCYEHAGLDKVLGGEQVADYFHVQPGDQRVPDIFGIAEQGVVYTGGTKKIAEHGGAHKEDLNVPLLVAGNPIGSAGTNDDRVHTTQIAPTMLKLLGLNPDFLQSVQIENTHALDLG